MKYRIFNTYAKYRSPATIWTRGGTVIGATQAYQWAIGKSIESLIGWWEDHGRAWRIDGTECEPPGGFTKSQVAPLRKCLLQFFGLDQRVREPMSKRPVLLLGHYKSITLSRSRSRRVWKVLVKRALPDREPHRVEHIVRNCLYTNYHHYLNKGRP